jgi:hypothetical protein
VNWARLADLIVPPWAVGLSMPAGDKELVQRYATQHRHPSTTAWQPGDPWHCTTDGVTSPCGDCDGCRYDQGHRRLRLVK